MLDHQLGVVIRTVLGTGWTTTQPPDRPVILLGVPDG